MCQAEVSFEITWWTIIDVICSKEKLSKHYTYNPNLPSTNTDFVDGKFVAELDWTSPKMVALQYQRIWTV